MDRMMLLPLGRLALLLALLASTAWRPLAAQDAATAPGAPPPDAAGTRLFDDAIAPLLARHCLECHDSASKEGGLDLSRKASAFAASDSGRSIVPGKPAESLLWQYVESDEMPLERPPLTAEDKQLLREWIETGASWSIDAIDPSVYLRDHHPAYAGVRRLTVPEYIQTVRQSVGINVEQDAFRLLPRDLRADGFSNTAYNLNVDLGHVQAYAELAEIIARRMDIPAFVARFTQSQELTEANMRSLIAAMGKWLLRGPLEQPEIESFLGISTAVAEDGGDFNEAATCIIEAMLQSPRFIYRIEKQRGDGSPRRVDNYELASRLSYILWGGPPDRELMQAADNGQLSDRSAVLAQVQRMLQDPRSVDRSAWFIHEWLNLGRLNNLQPNQEKFPHWNAQLAADMREETLAFFHDVAWEQQRPLSDLLNAQVTYLTPRLATHYGLQPQEPTLNDEGRRLRSVPQRGAEGLLALYTFQDGGGALVRDLSGTDSPMNLTIAEPSSVTWGEEGLQVGEATQIQTDGPATRIVDAIKSSNAVTLEVWLTPADTDQTGPARILTLSSGVGQRNFTLGQDGDRFDVRLRATRTSGNGIPSVTSAEGSAKLRPTHVAYTRDATGRAKLYIDGQQQAAGNIDGDLSNWDDGFTLAVANETTGDRPWCGTLHMAALYNRALTPEEIRSKGQVLSRYDLADEPSRGGLLTQGSVLTVGGDEASMVARGLFVLHDLLFSEVGDPPPCVDTTPVPTKPGLTQRAIAEARLADQSCAGCHVKFEPLAFGLEKFDGLGTFRERDEHGNQLREDGEIHIPGDSQPTAYRSSAEFADLLANSERVRRNMTRKVTQFAIGRPLVASDDSDIEKIHQAACEGGGTYASLITAIVMSDLVQKTATERTE